MKQIKKGKKLLAIALSVLLAAGSLPTMAFAEGRAQSKPEEGTCQHHPEHTADCGYEKGTPCKHSHRSDCFTDELICGYIVSEDEITDEEADTAATGSNWNHEHTQECFLMDCPHERGEHEVNDSLDRDDTCGYTEAHACGYICELCGQPDNIPDKKPADEAEQTGCSLTEGCTLSEGHEGECVTEQLPADAALVKTITGWTFVGDDNLNEGVLPLSNVSMEQQADFDMVASMLPTGILAEVEGETDSVPVDITGWDCPEYEKDANGNWPVTGEYVFMAVLPEGYACDLAPTVTVLMGGAEIYAEGTGDFTVTGGVPGTDYRYAGNTLSIITSTPLTISGTTTRDNILVPDRVTANLTLDEVDIDVHHLNGICAFSVAANSKATITLTGTNALESGDYRAGLEVPKYASVTIQGNGSITTNGGSYGAGIGGGYGAGTGDGGYQSDCGDIEITGKVNVTTSGMVDGAGIGGGGEGSGGNVIISGGTVNASSPYGAGIGGGGGANGGNGGNVEISGESTMVIATGASYNDYYKSYDVGAGENSTIGGRLSVTNGATLEMANTGTNAEPQIYRNCIIIDKNKRYTKYDENGKPTNVPTLSLEVSPKGFLTWPCDITLTAALSDTSGSNAGKDITFTGPAIASHTAPTNDSGVVSHTITIPSPGTYTFDASYAGDAENHSVTATLDITVVPRRDISNIKVSVTDRQVYTGSQLQPAFEVTDGDIAITADDYTISYDSNINAGKDAGGITLTGRHNYTGTKTVRFDIEQRALTDAVITLEAGPYTYKGSAVTPEVTSVVVDGITVPADAFDVHYSNNTGVGTATATITAKTDSNFSGFAGTSFEITRYRSSGGGGSSSGSSGSSSSSAPKSSYTVTGNSTSQSISRSDLAKLADGSRLLTIQSDAAKISLSPAALRAILAAVPETADSIIFSAVPADLSAYPDAAALIGAHPVYDFTISYKDAQGTSVSVKVDFPAGSVSIALNYAPASTEVTGNLFMVYVDGNGAVTWLDKSSYNNGKVLAEVPHFSVYGAAYKAPATVFTDISGHWAQADMEFAAARGLLSGTGNGTFSPDAPMTRGMFVTALGRLAGVNPGTYPTRSFADVAADAYYAPYAKWAIQRNIAGATGENSFSPDAPVTREQMAVILSSYAGQMGYSIPAPLAAAPFADNSSISEGAAREVAALHRAGVIRSKNGSRFEPQSSATRADGSAVLRRFVETVMDSSTVNGWLRNDSGQWFYYRNGVMAVNTTVDGYEIGPDGVMKEQ